MIYHQISSSNIIIKYHQISSNIIYARARLQYNPSRSEDPQQSDSKIASDDDDDEDGTTMVPKGGTYCVPRVNKR